MTRLAILVASLIILAIPASAKLGLMRVGVGIFSTSIGSISLSNTTYVENVSNTTVGMVSVPLNNGSFSGSLAIVASGGSGRATCSGGDTTHFQLVSNTLETNGSLSTAGPYTVNIQATQTGITNSPFCTSFTITGVGQSLLVVQSGNDKSAVTASGSHCTWVLPQAVATGNTIVGYIHGANDGDTVPIYPTSITLGSNTLSLTPSVNWTSFPEDIGFFYLTNVTGNPTTLTYNFSTTVTDTGACDSGFVEYSGNTGLLVVNPALQTGTISPSVTITPTSSALIWGFGTPFENDIEGALTNSGYGLLVNSLANTDMAIWGSNTNVSAGSQNLVWNYPQGNSYDFVGGAVAVYGPAPSIAVSSVSPTNCTFTTGTAGTCPLTITMNSGSFTGTASISPYNGSGSCVSLGNDLTDFGTSQSPYAVTYNGSTASGTYSICVKLSSSSVSTYYQPITVTVSPSGGGIPCTIGPNYTGSIPAGAQAAGLTTCAANYDFTSTSTFNNGVGGGSGYNFGTLSTWLDCFGASQTKALWYVSEDGLGNGDCPSTLSSQFQIVNDTANGGAAQELQLQYTSADYSDGYGDAKTTTSSPLGWPVPNGTEFPAGSFYVENVVRMPTATQNNSCPNGGTTNCILADNWSWESGTGGGVWEIDFIELYGPASNTSTNGGGIGGFGQVAEPGHVSGYNPNLYNTYAMRVTTNNSGNAAVCNYLNGAQIPANAGPSCVTGSNSYAVQHDRFGIMEVGPQGTPPFYQPSATQQLFVERVTWWSCSTWQTTNCASSPDSGSP
jgi:hypothetical protein